MAPPLSKTGQAARELREKGYHVCRIDPKTKRGYSKNYLQHSAKPESFQDGDNIGIRPTSGVVCVDLDCVEALSLAKNFLPPTVAVSGRKSKPRSHHYYNVGEYKIRAKKLNAQDGVRKAAKEPCGIADYLVDKCHVNAPPSVHPSGEELQWTYGVERPTEVDEETLWRAFQLLYIACMLTRHYPPEGARHDWVLAFSGYCKSRGLTQDEVLKLFHSANDPKLPDRNTEIRTTFAEEKVTGAPTLRQLMGDDGRAFTASIDRILGHFDTEFVQVLNERYFMCRDGSNFIYDETDAGELRKHTQQAFRAIECETVMTPKGKGAPKGDMWLRAEDKRFYDGFAFYPPHTTVRQLPNRYNLWKGFSIEPNLNAEHAPDLYYAALHRLCESNTEVCNYVIKWMAHAVQRPGELPRKALVFRTAEQQMYGKSFLFRLFGELFHRNHYWHASKGDNVVSRFNAKIEGRILIVAEEASIGYRGVETLKTLITEKAADVEQKGVDLRTVHNYTRLVLHGNSAAVVQVSPEDKKRLLFVEPVETWDDEFWSHGLVKNWEGMDQKSRVNHYFDLLDQEMRNGGNEQLLGYLMRVNLEDFSPVRDAPETRGWLLVKDLCVTSGEHAFEDQISMGFDGKWDMENEWVFTPREILSTLNAGKEGKPLTVQGLKRMLEQWYVKRCAEDESIPRYDKRGQPYPVWDRQGTDGIRRWVLPPRKHFVTDTVAVAREELDPDGL